MEIDRRKLLGPARWLPSLMGAAPGLRRRRRTAGLPAGRGLILGNRGDFPRQEMIAQGSRVVLGRG